MCVVGAFKDPSPLHKSLGFHFRTNEAKLGRRELLAGDEMALLFPVYMDLRTYRQHGVLYGIGLTAGEEAVVFLCQALALLVWSWTGALCLGRFRGGPSGSPDRLYFLFGLLPLLLFERIDLVGN